MSKESSSFSDEKTGVVAAGEKAADPALYIEPAEEAKLLRKAHPFSFLFVSPPS
jgi:hypothetical protein